MSDNPYANPNDAPEKKGGGVLKIIIIIFVVMLLLGLCCCGGGYAFISFGMGQLTNKFKEDYGDHEEIQNRIGPDAEFSYNVWRTGEVNQNSSGAQIQVFDVKGSNGSGEFQITQQGQDFTDPKLIVDGETIPLE